LRREGSDGSESAEKAVWVERSGGGNTPPQTFAPIGGGQLGFDFVWDLFSQEQWVSGIFTGRLRIFPPLVVHRPVTIASIISPATKPRTAPRRVAQNQPQLKVIPVSSISIHLLCYKTRAKKNVELPPLSPAGRQRAGYVPPIGPGLSSDTGFRGEGKCLSP
jgi:hypothetical protein